MATLSEKLEVLRKLADREQRRGAAEVGALFKKKKRASPAAAAAARNRVKGMIQRATRGATSSMRSAFAPRSPSSSSPRAALTTVPRASTSPLGPFGPGGYETKAGFTAPLRGFVRDVPGLAALNTGDRGPAPSYLPPVAPAQPGPAAYGPSDPGGPGEPYDASEDDFAEESFEDYAYDDEGEDVFGDFEPEGEGLWEPAEGDEDE